MKILLVEDEARLSQLLQKGLKKQGFAIDAAFDGQEALCCTEVNTYDLIILDLNLPKKNGFQVLEELRQRDRSTKVLILSAKNQIGDKVQGLDLGANDFLEKPFDFSELSARIRNLLRWNFVVEDDTLAYEDLLLNFQAKTVCRGTDFIPLTNKEYGILEYLARNRGRFVPAEEVIEHVWDSEKDLFSNSFKYHVSMLKKKLGKEGIISSSRGKGYQFGGEGDNL